MNTIISITDRGNITLPAKMRKILGIKPNSQIIAEVTDEGLLLRPAVTLPIEMYSEERIEAFRKESDQLEGFLNSKPVK